MSDADAMSREEIAAFLASLKKLRDGLDDFNCQVAAIDGAGRLDGKRYNVKDLLKLVVEQLATKKAVDAERR